MTKQQIEGWNFMSEVLDGSLAMDQFDFSIFFRCEKTPIFFNTYCQGNKVSKRRSFSISILPSAYPTLYYLEIARVSTFTVPLDQTRVRIVGTFLRQTFCHISKYHDLLIAIEPSGILKIPQHFYLIIIRRLVVCQEKTIWFNLLWQI